MIAPHFQQLFSMALGIKEPWFIRSLDMVLSESTENVRTPFCPFSTDSDKILDDRNGQTCRRKDVQHFGVDLECMVDEIRRRWARGTPRR